jgi:hypothetical protein
LGAILWERAMPFFHCNSTPLANGSIIQSGNWGRIILAVGWGHNQAFREAVFEHVRVIDFPTRPSRLNCSFFFDSEAEAIGYLRADGARSMLMIPYEVELLSPEAPRHAADWRAATNAIGPVSLDWVYGYWRGEMREPVAEGVMGREVIARTDMRIVRRL